MFLSLKSNVNSYLNVVVLAAFRALVEENVKANVQKIANSSVIRDVRSRITSISLFMDRPLSLALYGPYEAAIGACWK